MLSHTVKLEIRIKQITVKFDKSVCVFAEGNEPSAMSQVFRAILSLSGSILYLIWKKLLIPKV
jgi:hypothetical protein